MALVPTTITTTVIQPITSRNIMETSAAPTIENISTVSVTDKVSGFFFIKIAELQKLYFPNCSSKLFSIQTDQRSITDKSNTGCDHND